MVVVFYDKKKDILYYSYLINCIKKGDREGINSSVELEIIGDKVVEIVKNQILNASDYFIMPILNIWVLL